MSNKLKTGKKEFIDRDQFYTKPETVKMCIDLMTDFINKNNININDFVLIEPSVGSGNFYNKLPEESNKIAVDLYPNEEFSKTNEVIEMDFLYFNPDKDNKRYITVGNPPFGKKGILAKKFIEHSMSFSEYVFFIIPMGIKSNLFRNKLRAELSSDIIEWHSLPTNSFIFPNNEECNIDTVFAIVTKVKDTSEIKSKKRKVSQKFTIKHVNLNDLKKTYNKEEIYHIGEEHATGANFYIPHIVYKSKIEKFKLYDKFEDMGTKVGWAIFVEDSDTEQQIKDLDLLKNIERITNFSALRYSIRKKLLVKFIEEEIGDINE